MRETKTLNKRKNFSLIILCVFLLITAIARGTKLPRTGVVTWVFDGDTFQLKSGEKIRLVGINTPEKQHDDQPGECMGIEATRFAISLLKNKKVRLEYDAVKQDRYGRLLAYVFLQTGDMVNLILVQKGLAYVMTVPPNIKYRNLLLRAQRHALDAKRGMWQKCAPKKEEYYYVGNLRSFIFHRPRCRFGKRISSKNLIVFPNRRQAFYEGFYPCHMCKP